MDAVWSSTLSSEIGCYYCTREGGVFSWQSVKNVDVAHSSAIIVLGHARLPVVAGMSMCKRSPLWRMVVQFHNDFAPHAFARCQNQPKRACGFLFFLILDEGCFPDREQPTIVDSNLKETGLIFELVFFYWLMVNQRKCLAIQGFGRLWVWSPSRV